MSIQIQVAFPNLFAIVKSFKMIPANHFRRIEKVKKLPNTYFLVHVHWISFEHNSQWMKEEWNLFIAVMQSRNVTLMFYKFQ